MLATRSTASSVLPARCGVSNRSVTSAKVPSRRGAVRVVTEHEIGALADLGVRDRRGGVVPQLGLHGLGGECAERGPADEVLVVGHRGVVKHRLDVADGSVVAELPLYVEERARS